MATLGMGFGAWRSCRRPRRRSRSARDDGELSGAIALGTAILLVGALSTWTGFSRSLHTATGIATTSNAGNLGGSLHLARVASGHRSCG